MCVIVCVCVCAEAVGYKQDQIWLEGCCRFESSDLTKFLMISLVLFRSLKLMDNIDKLDLQASPQAGGRSPMATWHGGSVAE